MTTLNVGDKAPQFTLTSHDGASVALEDLVADAKAGVVVYFYPKAATPGCTTEACDFRDNLASLGAGGYTVVGISADSVEEIKQFANDQLLTFPLLSDEGAAVAQAYGAWGEKTINGNTFDGVLRSTFVVKPDGTLSLAQYNVEAEGHVAALRAELLG